MNLNSVLAKTGKGIDEIETRRWKLSARMRPVLLMVNASLTAGELIRHFEKIGNIEPVLQELLDQGFIKEASVAPASRRAAGPVADAVAQIRQQFVVEVHDALGPDGDTIAEQIENCTSKVELAQYLQTRRETFEGYLGKQKAADFVERIQKLLA